MPIPISPAADRTRSTLRRTSPSANLARYDLVTLQLVVLCADRGSLGAAARVANLSKPTASQRLAGVEAAVGAKLFDRNHKGVQATAAGLVFLRHAKEILNEVQLLATHFSQLHELEVEPFGAADGSVANL